MAPTRCSRQTEETTAHKKTRAARERTRYQNLREAEQELKKRLPIAGPKDAIKSRMELLSRAINYIHYLESLLENEPTAFPPPTIEEQQTGSSSSHFYYTTDGSGSSETERTDENPIGETKPAIHQPKRINFDYLMIGILGGQSALTTHF